MLLFHCVISHFSPKADTKVAADAPIPKSQESVFTSVEQHRDSLKTSNADVGSSHPASSISADEPQKASIDAVIESARVSDIKLVENTQTIAPAEVIRADDNVQTSGDQVVSNAVAPAVADSSTEGKQKKKKKGSYADF
jgi:hypothetical protein